MQSVNGGHFLGLAVKMVSVVCTRVCVS